MDFIFSEYFSCLGLGPLARADQEKKEPSRLLEVLGPESKFRLVPLFHSVMYLQGATRASELALEQLSNSLPGLTREARLAGAVASRSWFAA